MKITINTEILDLIAKKYRGSWSHPVRPNGYRCSTGSDYKSYRSLASEILYPLTPHRVNALLDSPVADVFGYAPGPKSLPETNHDFLELHTYKAREAMVSAVQNHGHKCIEMVLARFSCDVGRLQKDFVEQENLDAIKERTFQEFLNIHQGAKLSSLYKKNCLGEVWSLREIGSNQSDEIVSTYEEYEKNVEKLEKEYGPISFDEYCVDCSLDPDCSESLDEYESYKSDSLAEMNDYISEIREQHVEIMKLEPFSRKKVLSFGYFDFSICQSNTEGLRFEVIPYEWSCKHLDHNGKLIGLVSGSMYYPREEIFADWSDMSKAADIFSGQEVSYVDEFMRHCDDHGIEENTMEGAVVIVQHMQRNYLSETTKGFGFKNLEFALNCIQEKFDMGIGHVGIFARPYQHYFDTNKLPVQIERSRRSALNSIVSRAEKFLSEHGSNKYLYTIILPKFVI